MAHEPPELIEAKMEETRQSLTEKVAALEDHVVGSLQSATTAVAETVETVKAAVEDTVGTVKETVAESVETVAQGVKETFDVRKHIRENPWAMVGGAAALGVLAGMYLFRGQRSVTGSVASTNEELRTHANLTVAPLAGPFVASSPPRPEPPRSEPVVSEPRTPGLFDELLELASQELKKIGRDAIATASATLKQSLHQSINDGIPRLLDAAIVGAVDQVAVVSERPRCTPYPAAPSRS